MNLSARLSRAQTERLAVLVAALVLGLSAALSLPLGLPWLGTPFTALTVLLGVGLPFVGFELARRERDLPPAFRRRTRASGLLVLGACLGLSLVASTLGRGKLRILNLSDEPFAVFAGERWLGEVEPSSGESPEAGVELDVPAGTHELVVRDPGNGAERTRALITVQARHQHLFAPLSQGHCFRLELRGYGQQAREPEQVTPLSGASRFWSLPADVRFFSANPPAEAPSDHSTSGGWSSAVRHGRCASTPGGPS